MKRTAFRPSRLLLVAAALVAVTVATMSGCAKQGRPMGGPVDRTAPTVTGHTPAADATSVPSAAPMTINFSESMDRSRVQEAIFVAPSSRLDMDWKGRQVRIHVRGGLAEGRTYVVTVGTDARDLRGNRLEDSYSFAFATGERLDEGGLLGRVINSRDAPERGAYVWVYDLQSFDGRTGTADPAYVTQTGADGSFRFERLGAGSYRVMAFVDGNRNQKPDPEEVVALAPTDVELSQSAMTPAMTPAGDLRLARRAPPQVLGASVVDHHRMQLNFDRDVRVADLRIDLGPLPVEQVQSDPDNGARVLVRTALQQDGKNYKLKVHLGDTALKTPPEPLRASTRADTKAPTLRRVQPAGPTADAVAIRWLFSEPMDTTTTASWMTPAALPDSIPDSIPDSTPNSMQSGSARLERHLAGSWSWQGPWWLQFVPDSSFTQGSYEMTARMKGLRDRAGNAVKDSTSRVAFELLPPDQLGAIVGRSVWPGESGGRARIRLQGTRPAAPRVTTADSTGQFRFGELVAGDYVMTAWYDRNDDGQWNAGVVGPPYETAEPFVLHGTVTVAPGDIISLALPAEPEVTPAEIESTREPGS